MEKYTVDSISDGMAALLLRKDETVRCTVSLQQLPGVREGDIISAEISSGQVVRFRIEEGETEAARARIKAKLEKLKKRSGR